MPKFSLEEMEKRIRGKLHPPTARTPLTAVFEKIKGIARRKRLPAIRR